MDAKTQQIIDSARAFSASRGLDVRCPTCNAGIGKWCFDNTRTYSAAAIRRDENALRGSDGKRISHDARLAAAGIA